MRRGILRLVCGAMCATSILFPVAGHGATEAATAEKVIVGNSIEALQVNQNGSEVVVRLTMQKPMSAPPPSFSVMTPARIAFDFMDTGNGLGRSVQSLDAGDLRSANIVQVGDRTRLVLNLNRSVPYETRLDGKYVFITVSPAETAARPASAAAFSSFNSEPVAATAGADRTIRDINFRRGANGEARIIVDLGSPDTAIDIRRKGANLVVDLMKANLPEPLRRRLDVTDFGTPVTSVVSQEQGGNVQMTISPQGLWEHNAYQSDNQFVIEVKRVVEDPTKLVQGGDKGYQGEKLSLNFQNIDVRSVLQVIADFTNFNIITSETVQGSLTLRLKDVPWDQALDIILQAKGLDKRKNGNVIWIAPRDELAAREKLELEAKAQIGDLEPLVTETFRINYHKAKNVGEFLRAKDQTVLSKRGNLVVDERSNKLFVQDVAARLEDVRRLIAEIDLPARQVLIEARIVEATDTFSREIGARLGFGGVFGSTNAAGIPRTAIGGGLNSTAYQAGLVEDVPDLFADGQAVNLPVNTTTNFPGQQAGAISLVLWNSAATRFLDLEISALEADGRGKVVSRPKVMTADQIDAIIEQGVEIPYQEASSSGATSVSFKKANLSLKVKPQITPDGRVMLSLDVNKDTPDYTRQLAGGIPINTKHVKTEVLVENGGTVVIGGIYQQTINNSTSKVPFLGDVPVLGRLFRNDYKNDAKSELLIFITPRVVEDQLVNR